MMIGKGHSSLRREARLIRQQASQQVLVQRIVHVCPGGSRTGHVLQPGSDGRFRLQKQATNLRKTLPEREIP